MEPEVRLAIDARLGGMDELLAIESGEVRRAAPRADSPRNEKAHGRLREQQADDGRGLDHRAFVVAQPVETGGDERLDRRRDARLRGGACRRAPRRDRPFVDQHRDELLDEQRIALGCGRHARADLRREPGLPEQPVHHRLGLLPPSGASTIRSRRGPSPHVGSLLEQVVPGCAEHQYRHDQVGLGHVLDEVEQRRLGRVDVVDDDDERTAIGEHLDQTLDGPERLGERERPNR